MTRDDYILRLSEVDKKFDGNVNATNVEAWRKAIDRILLPMIIKLNNEDIHFVFGGLVLNRFDVARIQSFEIFASRYQKDITGDNLIPLWEAGAQRFVKLWWRPLEYTASTKYSPLPPECTEAITKDDVIRRLDKAIGHYRAELYKDSESDATRVAEKEASSWRRVLESLDYPDDPENPIDPLTAVLRRT